MCTTERKCWVWSSRSVTAARSASSSYKRHRRSAERTASPCESSPHADGGGWAVRTWQKRRTSQTRWRSAMSAGRPLVRDMIEDGAVLTTWRTRLVRISQRDQRSQPRSAREEAHRTNLSIAHGSAGPRDLLACRNSETHRSSVANESRNGESLQPQGFGNRTVPHSCNSSSLRRCPRLAVSPDPVSYQKLAREHSIATCA